MAVKTALGLFVFVGVCRVRAHERTRQNRNAEQRAESRLFGVVLGDGLGALGDGVLGQLARQQETHGGLHFAARDRRALVVARQAARLGGQALKDVVDEVVHDRHALLRDARVRVHLCVFVAS